MKKKGVFVAATGQNVGKTTICLGVLAGLLKRYDSVGFIKPVGQQHVKIDQKLNVDKDVVLFKTHFGLCADWEDMSPLIIPKGFTRDFLDGKHSEVEMLKNIERSFEKIASDYSYTLAEGTGHTAVGTIVNINNARVASTLGLDMVIIASGGLGSAHDELALNIAMCRERGVKVRGVILNRVMEDKREMILEYFPKSLKRLDVPLIGAIPFSETLSQPTIEDFANHLKTPLLTGIKHRYRHFRHSRLVADSVDAYSNEMAFNELIITPASREDIILANIEKHRTIYKNEGVDFAGGMIWTGYRSPSKLLIASAGQLDIPTLYVPLCSYEAMKKITSLTSKIRQGDLPKIEKAIDIVERHLNFEYF